MFTALQQIEGHIVAPTVFSQALRINPLLVIFALLIGGRLYGFAGAFMALPLAAVLRETVVYLRQHLVLEPWGTPPAGALGLGPPRHRPDAAAPCRRCPECGAAGGRRARRTARAAARSSPRRTRRGRRLRGAFVAAVG